MLLFLLGRSDQGSTNKSWRRPAVFGSSDSGWAATFKVLRALHSVNSEKYNLRRIVASFNGLDSLFPGGLLAAEGSQVGYPVNVV